LPDWLDWQRLLGADFEVAPVEPGWRVASARLEPHLAADVAARLRGVGFGGRSLAVEVQPGLERRRVRAARAEDARRRRDTSAGFSRPGVELDAEARISLTPEALALELGERAAGRDVVDACAGAGGNAIGFARAGSRVLAIERDATRLRMARHNARIYGVADRIEWHCGDALQRLPELSGELLFVDPPWGEHRDRESVGVADLAPLGGILAIRQRFARTWLKVPASFDVSSLPGATARAVFGVAAGDARRVKFLILELGA
jgi:SAM-dependent methyltransferase